VIASVALALVKYAAQVPCLDGQGRVIAAGALRRVVLPFFAPEGFSDGLPASRVF